MVGTRRYLRWYQWYSGPRNFSTTFSRNQTAGATATLYMSLWTNWVAGELFVMSPKTFSAMVKSRFPSSGGPPHFGLSSAMLLYGWSCNQIKYDFEWKQISWHEHKIRLKHKASWGFFALFSILHWIQYCWFRKYVTFKELSLQFSHRNWTKRNFTNFLTFVYKWRRCKSRSKIWRTDTESFLNFYNYSLKIQYK